MKTNAQVANFNVVFGEDEKPMLDYFDNILYPALTSGVIRSGTDEDDYFLYDVEVISNKREDAAIIGRIVKRTMLDVLSDLNESGVLIEKDEHYTSAPYSTFVIYLRNHRMLYVPNQKGSPTLVNFRTTVAYILKKYVSDYNSKNEENLPYALVNVVGVPSSNTIEELLKTVKKINLLTLKFYPLNGDVDFSDMFGMMTTDLRKAVGSKTGKTVLNSPKLVDGVVEVLQQAGGTIDPVLKVTTSENSVVRLQDYQMTEKYEMGFDDQSTLEQKREQIMNKADEISVLQFTNENHDAIYDRNKGKIIPFIKKNKGGI